ncbi:dnaJ homolog subfamily B member 5-like [Telopea speciosissima]|uniref:dnaJ homolog subfamily B member 5-like n=1 Tax=Telopea speciosissima TaxID=54955 RepID=UPI001CC37B9F|nr:dnaJ homolog subfamily B member 5-like [Telopea speciosissima]
MGEHHTRSPLDSNSILGVPKGASIKDVCKAYKSLVTKWYPEHKNSTSSKTDDEDSKLKALNEAYFEALRKKQDNGGGDHLFNQYGRSVDDQFYTPSFLSSTPNRRCQTPSPVSSPLSRNVSRKGSSTTPNSPSEVSLSRSTSRSSTISTSPNEPPPISRSKSSTSRRNATNIPISPKEPPLLRSMSKKSNSTPIMFSFSNTRTKPPPIEKQLACTLEELLNGCTKKIKVTRDVITNTGLIVQEEEMLRIKVKPGWKKGTKITFEAMGDEKPGFLPADIIFLIAEKRHPIFKREDNDLVLSIELPLVKALTGCTLSIPLLGGEKMGLSLDEIVHPGYIKIIPGKGMPDPKENGKRGDLRLKFRINFPTQLSDEQRSEVVDVLQNCD